MRDTIAKLDERLKIIENRFHELGYDTKQLVVTELKKRWRIPPRAARRAGG